MTKSSYKAQTLIMTKKTFLVFFRSIKTILIIFFSPFVICGMLVGLQFLFNSFSLKWKKPNPNIISLNKIPKCTTPSDCTTIRVAIISKESNLNNNYQEVEQIMTSVAKENNLKINDDIKLNPIQSYNEFSDFLESNKNKTFFGVVFCYDSLDISTQHFSIPCKPEFEDYNNHKYYFYTIVYNFTNMPNDFLNKPYTARQKSPYLMKLKLDIDNAFLKYLHKADSSNETPEIKLEYSDFPSTQSRFMENVSIVNNVGAPYFFFIPMTLFVLILIEVTREKQLKLRKSLIIIGLRSSSFWSGWIIISMAFSLLLTILLIVFCMILGWEIFINTPFPIMFTVFFLFILSMQFLSLFLSTILSTINSAYTVSFGFILIGFVINAVFSNPVTFYFIYSDYYYFVRFFRFLLYLYAPYNFNKAYFDIASIAGSKLDFNSMVNKPGRQYYYEDLLKGDKGRVRGINIDYDIPPTYFFIFVLIVDNLFYLLLTWYFDKVLESNTGKGLSPLFPFYNAIKCLKCKKKRSEQKEDLKELLFQPNSNFKGLQIVGCSKTYKLSGNSKVKFLEALKPLYMNITKGELMTLLGHNGAGKTTLLNILCGNTNPTSGYATLDNEILVSDKNEDSVNSFPHNELIGLCPQHDILWDELTPYEHIEIYAVIRGIPKEEIKQLVLDKLTEVNMKKYMNDKIKTFSGGMKRRISILLSTIGHPKVLFLDEPSTGLDPVNRRFIWKMIKQIKEDKTVIMTTHSMDEAEYLSDQISIIKNGSLQCTGSAGELKAKYGDGYIVNFICKEGEVDKVKELLKGLIPKGNLMSCKGNKITYSFKYENIEELNTCIKILNKNMNESFKEISGLVEECGIEQTSIEDVFRKITKDNEESDEAILPTKDNSIIL